MTTDPNIRPTTTPLTGAEPTASRPTARLPETSEENPSFRVLLERLQETADQLSRQSQDLDAPEQLSGAVDIARASLDDALSLGDRLLEAFREANQQNPDENEDARS